MALNMSDTPDPLPSVQISVQDDADARRIEAVLEALGYDVTRNSEGSSPEERTRRHVVRLTRKHKLTDREAEILGLVLTGRTNVEIAKELELSKQTIKWHQHNIFCKTNTGTREELLRLVLVVG